MPLARDWDGDSYDRVSQPMELLGRAVLERLELRGDETVLDAGCGTGRVTEALVERLARGRVIAVDASESMVRVASERLGGRAEVWLCDLLELRVAEPVDAIFSTATFHWISDHDRLYRRLRAALAPGGQLVAQCGGEGNIASVHAAASVLAARPPFASYLEGWVGPWNFTSPEQARSSLMQAGFAEARCWLMAAPVRPEEPHEYLRTVNLGAHLQRLPVQLRDDFVEAVLERLGTPLTIDYVRLNIDARA